MTLSINTGETHIVMTIGSDDVSVSDGYHTFGELYDHRITLWIALCRLKTYTTRVTANPVWRTRLHSDGTFVDGWFVLGMFREAGYQMTYHLPEALWDECDFATEMERAPDFDGHTPADVLERMKQL